MSDPSPDQPARTREMRVTAAFIDLADSLVDDFDPTEFLYRVNEHCMNLLDIADAGIMLAGSDGTLRLVSTSSERVKLVELFELDAEEGPCFTAFHDARSVDHPITSEPTPRWPRFTARAHQSGYTSVHATPIGLRGEIIGVLNLFRRTAGDLPPDDRDLARALAHAAAISLIQQNALEQHRTLSGQLQYALETRTVIEQAKGYLAARHRTDPDTAFQRLRAHARRHRTRLADLARDVVTGVTVLDPPDGPEGPARK